MTDRGQKIYAKSADLNRSGRDSRRRVGLDHCGVSRISFLGGDLTPRIGFFLLEIMAVVFVPA